MSNESSYFLPHEGLQSLLDALKQSNYECIGPQVRDDAIIYDEIDNAENLPWGMRDTQEPGKYRLEKTEAKQAFGSWSNGPQAIKPCLFKSREVLWKSAKGADGKVEFTPAEAETTKKAIIGVRACDLVAMAIQDKVFIEGQYQDARYKTRRENLFIVAVNCTYSSGNCFCVSAIGGPKAQSYFDIEMTELDNGFVVNNGSEIGESVLTGLHLEAATSEQCEEAGRRITAAAETQTKKLPEGDLNEQLFANLDHPQWDDVAKRCLSCGNCTQVCPTCFCHNEYNNPTLDGSSSEQIREWDSCFTQGHSMVHGHATRQDTRERYRQWLTHKLGSWHEQYGTSGCVGCGRCITWCPGGIDMTEEATAICTKKGDENE